MIELLIRHLVVLALAGTCSLALRHRSAALRHALWTIALVLCLLLPLLQRAPILLPVAPLPSAIVEPETSRAGIEGFVVTLDAPAASTPVAPAPRFPWATLAWGVYLAIAAGLVLRWTIGWGLAAQLARRGKRLGAARGVPVVAVEGVGPLTFGWPRGVIVVPNEEFALDKLVLRHEVAHVKRADFVWQGIGALACALWWFSPAVWLAARALRREAERACDDLVLSQGVSAPDYADCLLEVASMKPLSLPFAASLVPLARRGDLAHRIAALLAPNRDRRSARPLAVFGLTALLLPAGLTVSRPVLANGSGAAESPVAASLRSAARALPRLRTPVAPKIASSLPSPNAPSAPSPFAVAIPTPPASELQPAASADLAAPVARVAPISSAPNAPAPQDSPAPAAPAVPASPEIPGSLKGKKIVLDPGHGGTDRGAPGGKLYEADINLAIARKAAELLRKEGAIVTLTRDSDALVLLQARAKFSVGQDLFLSVHVDSGMTVKSDARPFPVRVYFHAPKDAPAPAEAASLASVLAKSAGEQAGFVAPDGKIYSMGFAVLRNAKCPAYLIDFGSMSFESDLAKLRDQAFLDKLAKGLVEGAKVALSGGTATVVVRPASSINAGSQVSPRVPDATRAAAFAKLESQLDEIAATLPKPDPVTVRRREEIRTERIPLQFEDAIRLASYIQARLEKREDSKDIVVRPIVAGNALEVQGPVSSVTLLKMQIALIDSRPSAVVVQVCEVQDGKPGSYFFNAAPDGYTANLLRSGGIMSGKVDVTPHINGDNSVDLQLRIGTDNPITKRVLFGQETRLELPYGIYLVTATERKSGSNKSK